MRNLGELHLPILETPLRVCKLIAARTQNLCRVYLHFHTIADADWLDTLVRANPLLERFFVEETGHESSRKTADETFVLLTSIFKVLRSCTRLRKVRLSLNWVRPSLKDIRSIFVPWRYRGVTFDLFFLDSMVDDDGVGNTRVIDIGDLIIK